MDTPDPGRRRHVEPRRKANTYRLKPTRSRVTTVAGGVLTIAVIGTIGVWTANSAAADTSVEQNRASAQSIYDKRASVLSDAVTRLADSRNEARSQASDITPLLSAPSNLTDPSAMSTFSAAYNSLDDSLGAVIPSLTTIPVITDARALSRDAKESAVVTIERSTKRVETQTKKLTSLTSDLEDSTRAVAAGLNGVAKTIAPSAQSLLDSTSQASAKVRNALSHSIASAQTASGPEKTAKALTAYITAAEKAQKSQSAEAAAAVQRALDKADRKAKDLEYQVWLLQQQR